MKVSLSKEAQTDALAAYHWYEERSPGLGAEFRLSLDATIHRISTHPFVYPEQHRGLRHTLVRRFPYAVYFRVSEDIILVVAVIHAKRHPAVARNR